METHRHTKDWLANLASSTQLCKKNMRKNQPWRCLCFGSALQITRMTPSRLTILQLRHNFLTKHELSFLLSVTSRATNYRP